MPAKLIGQQLIKPNDFSLNSTTVNKGSRSHNILTSLALANGKDLINTEIVIAYNVKSKLLKFDGNIIEVELIINSLKFSGDIGFRGFSVEKKIKPDFVQLEINLQSEGNFVESKTLNLNLSQEINKVEIKYDKPISKSIIQVSAVATGFYYSEETFNNFEHYTSLINNYYGYSLLLTDLNEKSKSHSMNGKEDVSTVFIHWHETARTLNLLENLQLPTSLNLKEFDPEKLIKKQRELFRYQRRSTTLLNKRLKAELEKGFTAQKQKYIVGIVDISNKYYKKSKSLQPYLASSFFSAISINQQAGELEIIKRISGYFDLFSYDEQIVVPVALNNLFIESAQKYLDTSKNNMALQQLINAQIIQEFFNLPKSEVFLATLATTLNGMIESYLRVSIKAFRSGNFVMAGNYYKNAEKVFSENIELFKEANISATPFSIYLESQKTLAKQLLNESKYEKAEKLLENCRKIILEKGLPTSADERKMMGEARNGVFENMIVQAQNQLLLKDIDSASAIIYKTAAYRNKHVEVDNSKEYDDILYLVFTEYLNKAEYLLNKNKHKEAVENLQKAREMETDLLGFKDEKLEQLLKNASVPVILEKVEQAGFYIWAKKTDEAILLFTEIKALQQTYYQQDNTEINAALQSLEFKMNNRHCVDVEFSIKQNAKLIVTLIEKGDFKGAQQLKDDTYNLIESNSECAMSFDKIDSISDYYNYVFVFYNDYSLMLARLSYKKYYEVIELYQKLSNNYFEHNIDELNFELATLYEFVNGQELEELTKAAFLYFVDDNQYPMAFEYLELLKQQGVESATTKELQIKLGIKFSQTLNGDDAKKSKAEELCNGDKWFKYFIKAMN